MKTHTWILIVLALLGGGVPGIARDQTVTPPDQVLLKEYAPPDRRFKIRFPDVPKEFNLQADTKTGPIVAHNVMHTSNITYWLVYTDYPLSFDKADVIKAALDQARDGQFGARRDGSPSHPDRI